MKSTKINNKYLAILLFIISFFILSISLYPEITNGDSGEFLSEAYHLGIAHPPGYPLFLIFLKLFIWLLPFNPALSGNIMSAFFASLAITLIFLTQNQIFYLLKEKSPYFKFISFTTSLIFLFTSTFFSQAIITEVYTLNLFLMLLTNYIFLLYIKKYNNKYLKLFFFSSAITITNHLTLIIILPFYLYLIYKKNSYTLSPIIKNSYPFFIGILIYSYLYIRANQTSLNWANPDTLYKIFLHITRAEYKNLNLVPNRTFIYFLNQIKTYFKILFEQFSFIILFSIPGIYYLYKKYKNLLISIFLFWFILSFFFVYYLNTRLDYHIIYTSKVFYIPSFVPILIFITYGLFYITFYLKYTWILSLLSLIYLIILNYNSQKKNFIAYDFSNNILKTITYKATLFTVEGDNPLFALAYLNYVEYKRPDLTYCNRYGKLFQSSKKYFSNLTSISDKELYFTSPEKIDPQYKNRLLLEGIIYKLKLTKSSNKNFLNYYSLRKSKNVTDFMDRGLAAIYYYRLAFYYKNYFNNLNLFHKYLKLSAKYGDKLEDIQKAIGDIFFSEKKFDIAEKYYKQIIQINPYNGNAYFYTGLCELNKKNFLIALSYFKKAYTQNIRSPYFYKVLAYTYYKLNFVYEAVIYLQEALKLYPDDKKIKAMLYKYSEEE